MCAQKLADYLATAVGSHTEELYVYKFGDFTRGSIRGIREATKTGAKMRGDDGNDYVPGDMTAGTMNTIGDYASNNKSRVRVITNQD